MTSSLNLSTQVESKEDHLKQFAIESGVEMATWTALRRIPFDEPIIKSGYIAGAYGDSYRLETVLPLSPPEENKIRADFQTKQSHEKYINAPASDEQSRVALDVLMLYSPDQVGAFQYYSKELSIDGPAVFQKKHQLSHEEMGLLKEIALDGKPNSVSKPSQSIKTCLQTFTNNASQDLKQKNKGRFLELVQPEFKQMRDLTVEAIPTVTTDKDKKAQKPAEFTEKMTKLGNRVVTVSKICSNVAKFAKEKELAGKFLTFGTSIQSFTTAASEFYAKNYDSSMMQFSHGVANIFSMFGDQQTARAINRFAPAAVNIVQGFTAFASGNFLGGFLGLTSGLASLFGDDDDDELGEALSAISNQVAQMHRAMVQGFNAVLEAQHHTMKLVVEADRRNMERFDHVDQGIRVAHELIIESYKLLTKQQVIISEHIKALELQQREIYRETMKSLQTLQTNILLTIENFEKFVGEAFTFFDRKMDAHHLEAMTQQERWKYEARARFSKLSDQLFQVLKYEANVIQQNHLLSEKLLSMSFNDHQIAFNNKRDLLVKQSKIFSQESTHKQTESIGVIHVAINESNENVLTGEGVNARSSVEILENTGRDVHWSHPNPFQLINLLKNYNQIETDKIFSHPDILMANVKTLQNHWKNKGILFDECQLEWQSYRDELLSVKTFAESLGHPEQLHKMLDDVSQKSNAFWNKARAILIEKESEWTEKYRSEQIRLLNDNLLQVRGAAVHLGPDLLETLEQAAKRSAQSIANYRCQTLDIFARAEHYDEPNAFFAMPAPGEKSKIFLPAPMDKFRHLPQELLQLEALQAGRLQFYYRCENKIVHVWPEFHFNVSHEKLVLPEQQFAIGIKSISGAWHEFAGKASVTEQQLQIIQEKLFVQQCLIQQNNRLNLLEAMTTVDLASEIDAMDASAGMLHLAWRLSFDSFCDDKTHPLNHILQSLQTSSRIRQAMLQPHFEILHDLLSQDQFALHDHYANVLTNALETETLYPINQTLNKYLADLELFRFSFIQNEELQIYVDEMLNTLPVSAHFVLLKLAADWCFERHQHQFALQYYALAQRLQPDNAAICYRQAVCLEELGHTSEAITAYESILNEVEYFKDRFLCDGSFAEYDSMMEKISLHLFHIFKLRGDALLRTNQPALAKTDFESALAIMPGHLDIMQKLALANEGLKKFDIALTQHQFILAEEKYDLDALRGEARCLRLLDETPRAFKLYANLVEDERNVEHGDTQFHFAKLAIQLGFNQSDEQKNRIIHAMQIFLNSPESKSRPEDLLFCKTQLENMGALAEDVAALADIKYKKQPAEIRARIEREALGKNTPENIAKNRVSWFMEQARKRRVADQPIANQNSFKL